MTREEMLERSGMIYAWHGRINDYIVTSPDFNEMRFMYQAKNAFVEVERIQGLFKSERSGELKKVHVQCATMGSPPEEVKDNHLTCSLGVECRKCPFLLALENKGDSNRLKDEQVDEIKAWTCVAHILSKGGDTTGEGFILTEDDRMYWNNIYASLARGSEE